MKILIFGATGLIGSNLYKYLSKNGYDVFGTYRNHKSYEILLNENYKKLIYFDFNNVNLNIYQFINNIKPDVIINCIGITKHINESVENFIKVNSLLPHQLAKVSNKLAARFIQISTDCVFSGKKGFYAETDFPDADDLYGRTKILGEVTYDKHLTVRISTIGRELTTSYGLLNWFLNTKESCNGYSKAIFSGIPSIYFAYILKKFILPNNELAGLYHISSEPIDKFTLLKMLKNFYQINIKIIEDNTFYIDRSLDSSKFSRVSGYVLPTWEQLILPEWMQINHV